MSLIREILRKIDLRSGQENVNDTLRNVSLNVSFIGANLWILALAILIASVGLNVNSTAVIIGAMLISPLMGPIIGAGFALGTYDFPLLRVSLRNLLIATFTGLLVSTVYFMLSPFKQAHSELLSRTYPTIYDVMIAFFGGLVGVIAVTRTEKGNPIPGVAIATALMPPLCTAGYGLSTGQWTYFLGAFYLYSINCVFICIATFFIVKYLRYPLKSFVDQRKAKLIRYAIYGLVVVMLVPSGYLAYTLLKKQQFSENVAVFLDNEFYKKGYTIIYRKDDYNSNPKTIDVAILEKELNSAEIKYLNDQLPNFGLKNTQLHLIQDTTNQENIAQSLKGQIIEELSAKNINTLKSKETKITDLENQVSQLKGTQYDNDQLLSEAQALFPKIYSFSLAQHAIAVKTDSGIVNDTLPLAYYSTSIYLSNSDKKRLKDWLTKRINAEDVILFENRK